MTEREAVRSLIGMMEKVKRQAGPAIGITQKFWPKATGTQKLLRDIYDYAKFVQDEMERM